MSPAERRHDVDAVSLMAGVLLVLLAGLFLLADLTDVSVDGRWAFPVVLIGVGGVGLLSALRSRGDSPGGGSTSSGPGAR